MHRELGPVTLKTGEKVEAGVVHGPDAEWADRLEKLLSHKGDPWNWQNSQMLRSDPGIEACFYVLHRDGTPFSHILTSELLGVGMLGHVWTNPEDRRKGACSALMEKQMEDFQARHGKALFLGTGFDSPPYHIYRMFGFHSVEPKSGYMDWYATSKAEFETYYFAKGKTEIQPLEWTHWPSSAALFVGDFPCVVRCASLKLIGRRLTEGPLLPLLRDEKRRRMADEKSRAMILRNEQTTAVVGFATWDWHPLWPHTCLVDVFCHPNYWGQARDLLASLSLPETYRVIAYGDAYCEHKRKTLSGFGFRQTSTLKDWVPSTRAQTSFLDVAVYERVA